MSESENLLRRSWTSERFFVGFERFLQDVGHTRPTSETAPHYSGNETTGNDAAVSCGVREREGDRRPVSNGQTDRVQKTLKRGAVSVPPLLVASLVLAPCRAPQSLITGGDKSPATPIADLTLTEAGAQGRPAQPRG